MRIGINVHFQYSFFSSGSNSTAFSLAAALKSLGHTPVLVNLNGKSEWYDDVQELSGLYEKTNLCQMSCEPLDLYIDIDGFVKASERRRIAKRVAVFLRKPAFLTLLEPTVYPVGQPLQDIQECDEIWTWDLYDSKDSHLLNILTKKPVIQIPFTWCPEAVKAYTKDLQPWSGDGLWEVHNLETNVSVACNLTLPMVAVAHAYKNSTAKFNKVQFHSSDRILQQQFFKENVLSHCQRESLEYEFVGRIRCSDLLRSQKVVVLSHIRFMTVKGALLDCAWNGIPIIHNSPFLKDLGLERYYYNDNSVLGVTEAFNNLEYDFTNKAGMFADGFLENLRGRMLKILDPLVNVDRWNLALNEKVKVVSVTKNEIVIGFSDVYDSFNYEYNFWTLLLNEAGKHLVPPVRVRGVDARTTKDLDLLMFGPFGQVWKEFSCPKIHFTGENSSVVDGVLNLGFKSGSNLFRFPLWIMYIDWFGANQERLVNPKTVPIDSVCSPVVCEKTKFCAFVVTNPTNSVRNAAFHELSSYKHVDSAGRLFNNVGDSIFTNIAGGGGGELKKVEFLKDYKFCLTYENGKADGYVTEKLLAAKAAGCVPIYWGADDVCGDFASGSFIYVKDNLVEAVTAVDSDPELWKSMAHKPAVDAEVVRKKLSDVARLILGYVVDKDRFSIFPDRLGASNSAEAQALGEQRGCLSKVVAEPFKITCSDKAKLERPNKVLNWNSKTLLVTFATQRYVEPLLKWLQTTQNRLDKDVNLSARVYLGSDVADVGVRLLKSQYPTVEFYRIPSYAVHNFPDIWEPQHFAWKLWIYQELVQEKELANTLIWYMDAASIIVRWPTEWFEKTLADGLCMLEDPEQINLQWCQPSFRARLSTTQDELNANQVVGGIMAFIGGSALAWKVFSEAWVLGQQKDLIVGPKWAGSLPDGRPCGHRHDQSILSILRLRRNVPVYPLYKVYNHESLRRCFKAGSSLYIHRGDFKEHEDFAPRIGEVHLINLTRRHDRLEKFKANHGSWTKKVCLRAAYDGKQLVLSPAIARVFSPNDFLWKKAITGCALSHLSLWIELANEQPICENYLILEDDVKFQDGWLETWKEASKSIPEDYDVLYLGGVLPPNRAGFKNVYEPVNQFWGRIAENRVFGQGVPTRYFHFCNYSYILSRKGAQKILEDIVKRGYTTSADHMVCNRMDMKHYVLNPLVAGCYQDEDPKYMNSEFNNFNRVDGFDSDLWNNDERFSASEIKSALEKPIDSFSLEQVLIDGRVRAGKVYTVGEHKLVNGSLLEYGWLNELLDGELDNQTQLAVDHDPLDSKPVFVCMKPHFEDYLRVFERYKAAGKEFYAIHLSDEHCSDPINWYAWCKHVFRPYVRPDSGTNVTYIPLGYYRSTKQVRELKDRKLVWSFYGTGWNDREAKLEGLKTIQPNTYNFFKSWMDSQQLTSEAYSEACLNSIFMPCPPGQNVETFRFYEALDHGVIPIYVRGVNDTHFEFMAKHLPLVVLDSWDAVQKALIVFLQKPELLQEYRSKLMTAWADWKAELKQSFKVLV